jgi:hypothetical protein
MQHKQAIVVSAQKPQFRGIAPLLAGCALVLADFELLEPRVMRAVMTTEVIPLVRHRELHRTRRHPVADGFNVVLISPPIALEVLVSLLGEEKGQGGNSRC